MTKEAKTPRIVAKRLPYTGGYALLRDRITPACQGLERVDSLGEFAAKDAVMFSQAYLLHEALQSVLTALNAPLGQGKTLTDAINNAKKVLKDAVTLPSEE